MHNTQMFPVAVCFMKRKTRTDDEHTARIHNRHRDNNGEVGRKNATTPKVKMLRRINGPGFAPGCADTERLSDVLQKIDGPAFSAELAAPLPPT